MTETPAVPPVVPRRTFGGKKEPIPFELNGATYFGRPTLSFTSIEEVLNVFGAATTGDPGAPMTAEHITLINDGVKSAFKLVLVPESYVEFETNYDGKGSAPVDIRDATEALTWIIGEAYGFRPTLPLSPSMDGSGPTAPSSTDGAPVAPSTPTASPGDDT